MIAVAIHTRDHGALYRVEATGHSFAFAPGENIVCAAVTVLLRTAARLLEADPLVKVSGSAPTAGSMEYSVELLDSKKIVYVQAVAEFLIQGIADLQREYPEECTLVVEEH